MLFSAEHHKQENNASHTNRPSSHDLPGHSEEHSISNGRITEAGDDPLVEHILDFLDKYPACFAPQTPLTSIAQTC